MEEPEDAHARWLFGNVLSDLGDWATAEKEYRRGLEYGLSANSALAPLAVAMLMQGKLDDVLALQAPSFLSDDAASSLAAVQTIAAARQGDPAAAHALLAKAARRGDAGVLHPLALAAVAQAEGRTEDALAILDNAVTDHPNEGWLWFRRAEVARLLGDLDKTHDSYAAAVERNPWRPRWVYHSALSLIEQGQLDAAEPHLRRLLELTPETSPTNYALGRYLLARERLEQAVAAFETSLRVKPDHAETLYYLGAVKLALGSGEIARGYLRRVIAVQPDAYAARKLLADDALGQQRYVETVELLLPAFSRGQRDGEGLSLYAGALIGLGRPEQAVKVMRDLVADEPDHGLHREQLALALLAAGRIGEALAGLDAATAMAPSLTQGDTASINFLLARGELDRALARADQLCRRLPDWPDGLVLRGRVHLARGERDQAQADFAAVPPSTPARRRAVQALAGMARAEGRIEEAEAVLRDQIANDSADVDSMRRLAALHEEQHELDQVEHGLKRAIAADPGQLPARMELGRLLIDLGRADEAVDILRDSAAAHPDHVELLLVYGTALLADGAPENAWAMARHALVEAPRHPGLNYLAARSALTSGDNAAALPALRRVLEFAPGVHPARRDLAELLLVTGALEEAWQQAAILLAALPDDPRHIELAGRIQAAQGLDTQAQALLRLAYARAPTRSGLLALGRVEGRLEDLRTPVARYRDWLQANPTDTGVRLALANVLAVADDDAGAVEQWQQILADEPDNLIALNNLAWTLRDQAPEQALRYAVSAYDRAPSSPVIADTYATLRAREGELTLAERALGRALVVHPDAHKLAIHRAEVLIRAERTEEAAAVLEPLLALTEDHPERSRAAELLAGLDAAE
jgi:putative PEP-CTERM system TPR-repeat lipoprotein